MVEKVTTTGDPKNEYWKTEEILNEELKKRFFKIQSEFAGNGNSYMPLCRVSDKGIFYIFLTISAVCITCICLLLVFSFITLPILIDGW